MNITLVRSQKYQLILHLLNITHVRSQKYRLILPLLNITLSGLKKYRFILPLLNTTLVQSPKYRFILHLLYITLVRSQKYRFILFYRPIKYNRVCVKGSLLSAALPTITTMYSFMCYFSILGHIAHYKAKGKKTKKTTTTKNSQNKLLRAHTNLARETIPDGRCSITIRKKISDHASKCVSTKGRQRMEVLEEERSWRVGL